MISIKLYVYLCMAPIRSRLQGNGSSRHYRTTCSNIFFKYLKLFGNRVAAHLARLVILTLYTPLVQSQFVLEPSWVILRSPRCNFANFDQYWAGQG